MKDYTNEKGIKTASEDYTNEKGIKTASQIETNFAALDLTDIEKRHSFIHYGQTCYLLTCF